MKRFSSQQIVEKLRQADIELGKGKNTRKIHIKSNPSNAGTKQLI